MFHDEVYDSGAYEAHPTFWQHFPFWARGACIAAPGFLGGMLLWDSLDFISDGLLDQLAGGVDDYFFGHIFLFYGLTLFGGMGLGYVKDFMTRGFDLEPHLSSQWGRRGLHAVFGLWGGLISLWITWPIYMLLTHS